MALSGGRIVRTCFASFLWTSGGHRVKEKRKKGRGQTLVEVQQIAVAGCRRLTGLWAKILSNLSLIMVGPVLPLLHGLGTSPGSSQRSNIRAKSAPQSFRTSSTRRHARLAPPDDEMALPRWAPRPHRLIPRAERADTRMFSPIQVQGQSRWIGPIPIHFIHRIAPTSRPRTSQSGTHNHIKSLYMSS